MPPGFDFLLRAPDFGHEVIPTGRRARRNGTIRPMGPPFVGNDGPVSEALIQSNGVWAG